jgi:hypothetical protein
MDCRYTIFGTYLTRQDYKIGLKLVLTSHQNVEIEMGVCALILKSSILW